MRMHSSTARRLLIRELLGEKRVRSQAELVALLARRGHRVTQTTVSRDLAALGAVKRTEDGGEFYALGSPPPAEDGAAELARVMSEFVVSIDASFNLAVIRTTPGSAGTVAAALDGSKRTGIVGSLAGDDTILIVTERLDGGKREAGRLRRLVARA